MKQSEVASHFDSIAPSYDKYKKKNPHYYSAIKNNLKDLIPPGKKILDYGCGTGEILAHLSPSFGVGYDISPKMVEIARKKFKSNKNLRFVTQPNAISGPFDFLLMIDVVEHLEDPQRALGSVKEFMNEESLLVLSFVDSSWEPILWILEKLGLKMPEGPHKRVTTDEIIEIGKREELKNTKIQRIKIIKPLPFTPISFLLFRKR
ncbi:hypothetical protein A3E46_02150 [Candidatus Woesebacteria bacterium RIFCSPHIGHO2_12_FULL_46_16]|uniref:Methyltransferase domain-containing protein n=1 Tax=Candidatus Woesebacteria bacterium RIFCSPHIGHO2_12_FULL_46_16 TaxID=1802513 RepID=A0A1F8B1V9_9BACT|nr:MAG: hypothetical protein A3E46_02150 [Candidatus Woesebacteria bacterium RIFCSPHIGHO2_12_FULL_46_16]